MTKFRDTKIDIFDIIEKNVILCVLEMSAFGTTLMAMSLLVILCLGINLNILQRAVIQVYSCDYINSTNLFKTELSSWLSILTFTFEKLFWM